MQNRQSKSNNYCKFRRYVAQDVSKPIKSEVGIEDCLHLEFEYAQSQYHLKDVIVGKVTENARVQLQAEYYSAFVQRIS